MHVIWWILLILAAVIGLAGIIFSLTSLLHIRKFARDSRVTIATVVGQAEVKHKKGKLPVVQFRTAKSKVTAKALVFEQAAISMGQKVNIRYLGDERTSPDKWDVRIIGKSGYGMERTSRLSAIVLAVAAVILIAAVTVMIVCG